MKALLNHPLAQRAMRGASLVVTDRRWAAPLSALALGFGLFVGIAIGPGAAGTLATGAGQIIELPEFADTTNEDGETTARAPLEPSSGSPSSGGGEAEPALLATPPLAAPSPSAPGAPAPPPAEKPVKPAHEEPEPEAQTLAGTVVHQNPAAGSYALALGGGELISVHAAELPEPGSKLRLQLRRLSNGTFAEDGAAEEEGRASKATFHGTVSFVEADPVVPGYTVSGRGASLFVRVRPGSDGLAPELPALGSFVTVTATIAKPRAAAAEEPQAAAGESSAAETCAPDPSAAPSGDPEALLWQSRAEAEGPPTSYLDLAGVLSGICADRAQLLLSADDARESGKDLLISVPAGIELGKLRLGDSFLATATLGADGSLTLAGIAADERLKGADDVASAQGDLKG